MPEQAEDLISKIMSHPNVDVENDWKLVTLLIGGNDLCGACRRVTTHHISGRTSIFPQMALGAIISVVIY